MQCMRCGSEPTRRVEQARIEANGELLFRTTQQYPVITQGSPSAIDLALERVTSTSPNDEASGRVPKTLVSAAWELVAYQRAAGNVEDLFLCAPQALYTVNKQVEFTAYRTTFERPECWVSRGTGRAGNWSFGEEASFRTGGSSGRHRLLPPPP